MAGITSTKKIKGQPHLLAYITPNEVEKLKALGGQETMTPEGIPAYPEYDNYGYSSDRDFQMGNKSKSNDPNVNRDSTFETYRGNKNIGTDLGLMAKYGTPEQKKEANEALARGQTYGYGPNQNVFEKMGTYNMNYKNAFVNRQIEKKNKALRDYISKQLQLSPHMDVDEIIEGLAGSYDPITNTFGKYTFTKGFQKGQTFDLSKYGNTQLGPFGLSTTGVTGKTLGTKYLDQTPDFASHPSKMPSTLGFIASKFSPVNMNTLKSHFNRVNLLENIKKDGVTQAEIDDYYDRTMGRGDYNIFGPTGGGDGPQPYLPIDYNTGAALPVDDIAEEKTFDYRFGDTQNVGENVLRGYVADGGRISKAGGGIMDTATGRKGFILGGIADAVGDALGSVADAAGKVLNSDIGKLAIMGAGIYYGGGGGNPFTAAGRSKFSMFGPTGFFSKQNPLLFTAKKGEQVFDPLKMAGLITLGGAMAGPAKVDQMPDGSDRGGKLLDSQGNEVLPSELRKEVVDAYKSGDADKIAAIQDYYKFLPGLNAVRLPDITPYLPYPSYATGGRVAAQEGGLMDLGGMEKDYRNTGGFVDIGAQEKADDVPARLSVNEFVMTADAVRNAGGGDIDKGAEVMENMMKNLENGGRVSEESQGKGNTGVQEMFSVSERIGEVI